jgi:hypothetical protein
LAACGVVAHFDSCYPLGKDGKNMEAILCTALIVIGLVAARMLFMNPAWLLLPKSWQRRVLGRPLFSYWDSIFRR